MPVNIAIKVNDQEVQAMLKKLAERMGDLEPVMMVAGEIMQTSIQRNFEDGGRPSDWKPLAKPTIAHRIKQGRWPGKILIRNGVSGGLLGSLNYKAYSDKVVVGTNKVYAAIHHFGGKAGPGKKVRIPARPYMLLQEEDLEELKATILDFTVEGKT